MKVYSTYVNGGLIRTLISILYQIGISVFFLGYLIYTYTLGITTAIPHRTRWRFPLPSKNDQKEKSLLIWIHAVSGGEVKLASRIIREFYPPSVYSGEFFLTYSSAIGKEMAEKTCGDHPCLHHSYLPIDFLPLTRHWVQQIQRSYELRKFIVIEHDFWPNWLEAIKGIGTKRIGVNFFLKPRDYSRYRIFPPVFRLVHNLDLLLIQNEDTAKKVMEFHPPFQTVIAGNMKYGIIPRPSLKKPSRFRGVALTLGSSHSGEEELLLQVLRKYWEPKNKNPLRLILIPRHPHRAGEVASLISSLGLKFDSTSQSKKLLQNIILVDEIGRSEEFYQQSDIVIIGDTLIPSQGGHNFLEPLAWGKCVIYGPQMVNFSDITPMMEREGGVIRIPYVNMKKNLEEILDDLIINKNRREKIAKTGTALLKKIQFNRKVYQKALAVIS